MAAKKPTKKSAKKTKAIEKHKVQFKYYGPDAVDVYLTGDFNKWNPIKKKMKKNEKGEWLTRVILPEGEHQYKYIVNGEWINDPGAVKYVDNGMGGANGVKIV